MKQDKWKSSFPETPKRFQSKVDATLASLGQKKEKEKMKFKKRFAVPMVALLVVLALGTTALATGGKISSIISSSSAKPTYTQLPTDAEVKKDLGYDIKLMDAFANGYTFNSGTLVSNKGLDEQDNTVDSHNSLSLDYEKGKDAITLSVEKWAIAPGNEGTENVATYKDISLNYTSYANKSVAGDYKMTEQDKKDEASGKYVFSYGIEKETIDQVQGLSWVQDGISYSLLAVNSPLSQTDLIAMAEELIDK